MSDPDDINPYEAPHTPLDVDGSQGRPTRKRLASRLSRLGAALIDTVLNMTVFLAVLFVLGASDQLFALDDGEPEFSLRQQIVFAILGIGAYLGLHGYLIAAEGQTIGKRLLGIRMVRRDGSRATFSRIVLYRLVPLWIVVQIPVLGNLVAIVDVLFIFASDRRCLHDHVADTIVVRT